MENNGKNRIKVKIAGTGFTLLSAETEEYTSAVAEKLNAEIAAVRKAAPGLSLASAVMLAALNVSDAKTKAEQDADLLRTQIKEYLNEAAKYRAAYEEAASENEKLRKDIETYRKRLGERNKAEPAPVSPAVRSVRKTSATEEAAEDSAPFFNNGGTEQQ